jgi:hypothetical protein
MSKKYGTYKVAVSQTSNKGESQSKIYIVEINGDLDESLHFWAKELGLQVQLLGGVRCADRLDWSLSPRAYKYLREEDK